MPFSTLFNVLLAAGSSSMPELLSLFSSIAPATLHLASHATDAAWHIKNTSLDVLVLENGLSADFPLLKHNAPLLSSPPRTLYLGGESDLVMLPVWLAPAATVLPWPGRREPVQQWIEQNIGQAADHMMDPGTLRAGPLQLDLNRLTIGNGHEETPLTATEATLLSMLIRNSGNLVSRSDLVAASLDSLPDPKQRRLDTHISNLRRKLQACTGTAIGIRIQSHRGRGYTLRFEP